MRLLKKLLPVILLLVCSQSFAQIFKATGRADLYKPFVSSDMEVANVLFKGYPDGYVKTVNDSTLRLKQMNFDFEQENVFYMNGKNRVYIKDKIKEFAVFEQMDTAQVLLRFKNGYKSADDRKGKRYYQVLFDSTFGLLKLFKAEPIAKAVGATYMFNEYTIYTSFYLLKDNTLTLVPRNKNELYQFIAKYSQPVAANIMSPDFAADRDNDIMQIIYALNFVTIK